MMEEKPWPVENHADMVAGSSSAASIMRRSNARLGEATLHIRVSYAIQS